MSEDKITRNGLLALLHEHITTITFTKKDGSERVMRCTLKADLLPERKIAEGNETSKRQVNLDIVPVYDLDKNGWRSIRVESVKNVVM